MKNVMKTRVEEARKAVKEATISALVQIFFLGVFGIIFIIFSCSLVHYNMYMLQESNLGIVLFTGICVASVTLLILYMIELDGIIKDWTKHIDRKTKILKKLRVWK